MELLPSCMVLSLPAIWNKKLVVRGKLIFSVELVREEDSPNTAISMKLHFDALHEVCPISPSCEVRQVKLHLVPAFI